MGYCHHPQIRLEDRVCLFCPFKKHRGIKLILGGRRFSGDTTPCDALVEVGMGATLLIHEATIQDDMPEVAIAKGHSTFGQAIDIARRFVLTLRTCSQNSRLDG